MGRPSTGWRLRKRKGRPYSVRFTVGGIKHEPGLGTHDRAEAERLAAELYADAVRGARRVARRTSARGQSITEVAGQWLDSVAPMLDPTTRSTYARYAVTHWAAHWSTLEAVTKATAAQYARKRLTKVRGATVRKELSALRSMMAWCEEQGLLVEAPIIPGIPKRTLGTKHKQGRKGPKMLLTPDEIQRVLEALPERALPRWGAFPIKAYFVVFYETSLRPETLDFLSVPEHWRLGQTFLDIPRELDKARAGRPVPLTPAALRALESVSPERGLIFGPRRREYQFAKAAKKVLDPERAKRVTQYFLRHSRITHWTEQSSNLAGVQYLAGHSSIATTALYVEPSRRAAEEVLAAAAKHRNR